MFFSSLESSRHSLSNRFIGDSMWWQFRSSVTATSSVSPTFTNKVISPSIMCRFCSFHFTWALLEMSCDSKILLVQLDGDLDVVWPQVCSFPSSFVKATYLHQISTDSNHSTIIGFVSSSTVKTTPWQPILIHILLHCSLSYISLEYMLTTLSPVSVCSCIVGSSINNPHLSSLWM